MYQNCKEKELELELVSHECENYILHREKIMTQKTENYEIKKLQGKKERLNPKIPAMGMQNAV